MTAEIVVMNRDGVAMAADSAVTIGGGPKILNTANKVFMLASGYPVGVLVYNNAAFMAVPWEIIIKSYRDEITKKGVFLAKLEDYAIGFFDFIKNNGRRFVTEEQELGFFDASTTDGFNEIIKKIWAQIKHVYYEKAEISDAEIESIVDLVIGGYLSALDNSDDVLEDDDVEIFHKNLLGKFNKKLEERINAVFEKFPISSENVNKLKQIAILRISKSQNSFTMNNLSGIVFAGYGDGDLFPQCVEYHVYGYYCEKLVFAKRNDTRVGFSQGELDSVIMPFAQGDVAENLLSGRHPRYEKELLEKFNGKFPKEDVKLILESVDKVMWEQYTQSIIRTISILPKDELATVARTLVNLTSFMRKVSSDLETVGGPVDVAVISKKDGFVWIDRKHYFDMNKNFHFRYNA